MQALREQGIYVLPDGRELVAHAVFRGSYVLYDLGEWEFFGIHAYETNAAGHICSKGRHTPWRVVDLIDTRRTARSRSRSGAGQKRYSG